MQQAFVEFRRLFLCPLCQQTLSDPRTISECSHTFCADCILPVLGEQCRCPQCGTLARVKNCKSNPAQNNILDHIQQLERELLNSDSSSDFGDDDYPDGREQQLAACKDEQFTSGRRRKSAQMAMANVRTLYEQTAEWSAPISSGTQSTANGPNIIITDTTQLKQAHIIFSGVCVKERRQLEQKLTALKLPVKISFGDEFDGSTHLVVKCNEDGLCGRTSKYLLSILSHRWILRIDWLLDIVRTCKWQPEELYEVCGDTQTGRLEGPRRSRQTGKLLFADCSFRLQGDLFNNDDLHSIIRCGGGKIVSKSASVAGDNAIIELYLPSSTYYRRRSGQTEDTHATVRQNCLSHPVNWLYDCISAYQMC